MSWIKMRASLLTNPKVIAVARALLADPAFLEWSGLALRDVTPDVTRDGVAVTQTARHVTALLPVVTRITVGALLPLWSTVNECATEEGILRSTDAVAIDAICGVPGMGDALADVAWIELFPNENEVSFSNFHEHNTVGRTRGTRAKTPAERSKDYRDKKKRDGDVMRDVTDASQRHHREEKSREDKNPPLPPATGGGDGDPPSPTKAGAVCKAIRAVGVADVNPSNPELLALIAKGVTVEVFVAAAQKCVASKPAKGMSYLLAIVRNQLTSAAEIAAGLGVGAQKWDSNRATIEAAGAQHGLRPWNDADISANRETFAQYTERVRALVEQGQPA